MNGLDLAFLNTLFHIIKDRLFCNKNNCFTVQWGGRREGKTLCGKQHFIVS